jgi:hypothetical protein
VARIRQIFVVLASTSVVVGTLFVGTHVGAFPTESGPLPNSTLTPGAVDKHVTQANIAQTICTAGYTKSVRNVSTKTKAKVYAAYGISKKDRTGYVIDHLVPLELGGSNDVKNLWPEPKTGEGTNSASKDAVEDLLNALVCSRSNGAALLAVAQLFIAADWRTAVTKAMTTTTTTRPPATTRPPVTTAPGPPGNCNPNYTPCVPNDPVDVDCAGGSGNGPSYVRGPVRITGTDVYGLDGYPKNGIGCE